MRFHQNSPRYSECCEGSLRQQVRFDVRPFRECLGQHLLHLHDVDAECDRYVEGR